MTPLTLPTASMVLRHYRLQCPLPALAAVIAHSLQRFGWETLEHAPVGLLVDGPWGVALNVLSREHAQEWVVVTDNPCPEYWEDLSSFWPRGLLAGGHTIGDLADALNRAHAGESFRRTPQHDSPLTWIERRLLRYSAMGWENRRIAQELKLHEGTVRNGLSRIFQKLGFENRTQVALYYWGLWHVLESPPSAGDTSMGHWSER